MKLKLLIIISILTIIISPSTLGHFQVSETDTTATDSTQIISMVPTWVKFCCGRISDRQVVTFGYGIIGFGFHARNLICIINFNDKPLFHHFKNDEVLAISNCLFFGIITENFICAFSLSKFDL